MTKPTLMTVERLTEITNQLFYAEFFSSFGILSSKTDRDSNVKRGARRRFRNNLHLEITND